MIDSQYYARTHQGNIDEITTRKQKTTDTLTEVRNPLCLWQYKRMPLEPVVILWTLVGCCFVDMTKEGVDHPLTARGVLGNARVYRRGTQYYIDRCNPPIPRPSHVTIIVAVRIDSIILSIMHTPLAGGEYPECSERYYTVRRAARGLKLVRSSCGDYDTDW